MIDIIIRIALCRTIVLFFVLKYACSYDCLEKNAMKDNYINCVVILHVL